MHQGCYLSAWAVLGAPAFINDRGALLAGWRNWALCINQTVAMGVNTGERTMKCCRVSCYGRYACIERQWDLLPFGTKSGPDASTQSFSATI